MKCPRCEHQNPQGARFCEECATLLAPMCSNCGTPLSATAKFCHACAHPVAVTADTLQRSPAAYIPKHLAEKILTSKAALEGERKQVTVLFADLKGSMELLADRDPEEARKILDLDPVPRANDGGRPSLRGHRQSGSGRRDHGALRGAPCPGGPRSAGLLRRSPHAGGGEAIRRADPEERRRDSPHPRRPQLGRSRSPSRAACAPSSPTATSASASSTGARASASRRRSISGRMSGSPIPRRTHR